MGGSKLLMGHNPPEDWLEGRGSWALWPPLHSLYRGPLCLFAPNVLRARFFPVWGLQVCDPTAVHARVVRGQDLRGCKPFQKVWKTFQNPPKSPPISIVRSNQVADLWKVWLIAGGNSSAALCARYSASTAAFQEISKPVVQFLWNNHKKQNYEPQREAIRRE